MNTKIVAPSEESIVAEKIAQYESFLRDPFLGYDSLEDAVNDCKYTSQAEVLARLFAGENLFISGPAGSGKTFVIKRFIDHMNQEMQGNVKIAVTASTGIAAQLIGGRTIHSWSGIGLNKDKFEVPLKSEWTKLQEIASTNILIIDEISMLPAYFFERLNGLLKYAKRSSEPFGGIQIVVMGDFLQLPPVDSKEFNSSGEPVNNGFAVLTEAWKEAKFNYCYMDKVKRASDEKLKSVLDAISSGSVTKDTISTVQSRVGVEKDPSKRYITLFTTNRNVEKYNNEQLGKNPNKSHWVMNFVVNYQPDVNIEQIKKSIGFVDSIELKVGAPVILTKNYSESHVNGSIGVVKKVSGVAEDTPWVDVLFNDGEIERIYSSFHIYTEKEKLTTKDEKGKTKVIYQDVEKASFLTMPLKLGYAISVHKSQGQTFDAVEVDLKTIFTNGLGYVALSRVRSLDDLIIMGISNRAYDVDPKSLKISQNVKKFALKRRAAMLENIAESKERELQELEKRSESLEAEGAEKTDEFSLDNSDDDDEELLLSEEDLQVIEEREKEVSFISYEQVLSNPLLREAIWGSVISSNQNSEF